MAYQPKSYRKFVATAATATLVASVVTPALAAPISGAATFTDVPAKYQEGVNYLVDNKITLGLTPETFGTNETITRVDAAVMIGKALEIDVANAPDSGFVDVPNRAKAYVDALKAAGIINGVSATELGSAQEITRGQMALIIAKAYKLTGDASKNPFTDVSSRYADAVAALVDNKITSGTSATSFGTNAAIKRGDFATFLFKVETQQVVAPAVESVTAINSTTLEATFEGTLTAEEVAELKFAFNPALKVTKVELKAAADVKAAAAGTTTTVVLTTEVQAADTKYSLVSVNGAELTAPVEVTPAPVEVTPAPEVTGVSAINLKQVEVKFSQEVDKASAETLANYKYTTTSGAAVLTGGTAVVQADGKTVVLTFATQGGQQEAGKVEVKNVLGTDGVVVATVEKDVRFFDATVPTVNNVQVVGPRLVKISFSEPLTSAPTVKLDNGSISSSATLSADKTSAIVEFGIAPSVGAHELTVSGGADFAGFAIESAVKGFTYNTDTTAPVASVKAAAPGQVTVKFSKPVAIKVAGDVNVYHTINNSASYAGGTLTPVNPVGGYAEEFTVTFATPLAEGTSKVFLNTKANAFEDAWGNDVAATELSASVVLDKAAPTVTGVKALEDSKFEVTLSESVAQADAENVANYTLKDGEGKVVSLATAGFAYNDTTKKVTITLGTDLKAGNYQLTVKDIADKALVPNKLVEKAFNVTVADTTPWTIAKFENAGTNKYRVTFNEAMSDEGLANLANYELTTAGGDAIAFPTDTKITKISAKSVLITAPTAPVGTVDKVRVNGKLKDVAGNAQTTLFQTSGVIVVANITGADLVADSSKVTGPRTLEFSLNQELTGSLTPASFTIAGKTVGGVSYVNADGKAKVTVTLSDASDPFAANADATLTVADNALTNTLEDKNASAITVTAVDAIAPTVTKTGDVLNISQTADAQITVAYSENLNATNQALYAQDLVLVDKDNKTLVAGVDYTTSVSGANLLITLQGDYAVNTYTGAISVASKSTTTYIVDANNVKATPFAAKTVTYKGEITAPTIVSAKTVDSNKNGKIDGYKVVFSEAVKDSTLGTFTVAGYTVSGITSGTADDNTITINLTEGASADTGATPELTAAAGQFADVAGNTSAAVATATVTEADAAAPVLLSSTLGNGGTAETLETTDTLTLVFSEAMNTTLIGNVTVGAWTVGGADPFDNSFAITTAEPGTLATVNVSTSKAVAASVGAGTAQAPAWTADNTTAKILLNGAVTTAGTAVLVDGTLTTDVGVGAKAAGGEVKEADVTVKPQTSGQF